MRKATLEAYDHQQAPFEKVVERVVKERDWSRNPLFQVTFTLEKNVGEVKGGREGEALPTAMHVRSVAVGGSGCGRRDGLPDRLRYGVIQSGADGADGSSL